MADTDLIKRADRYNGDPAAWGHDAGYLIRDLRDALVKAQAEIARVTDAVDDVLADANEETNPVHRGGMRAAVVEIQIVLADTTAQALTNIIRESERAGLYEPDTRETVTHAELTQAVKDARKEYRATRETTVLLPDAVRHRLKFFQEDDGDCSCPGCRAQRKEAAEIRAFLSKSVSLESLKTKIEALRDEAEKIEKRFPDEVTAQAAVAMVFKAILKLLTTPEEEKK